MIKFYYSSTNLSCGKAEEWLKEHNLEYEKINWDKENMSLTDFFKLLSLTENGTQDIIATKSNPYSSFSRHVDDFSLRDVYFWIHYKKTLLRLPLIMDNQRLQVGFNQDSIRKFIPREVREIENKMLHQLEIEKIKKETPSSV
jgi:regulatory protein spx